MKTWSRGRSRARCRSKRQVPRSAHTCIASRGRRASAARGSARWVQVRQLRHQSFHGRCRALDRLSTGWRRRRAGMPSGWLARERPDRSRGGGIRRGVGRVLCVDRLRIAEPAQRIASACRSVAAQGRGPAKAQAPLSSVSRAASSAAQGLKFTILGDENVPTHGGAVTSSTTRATSTSRIKPDSAAQKSGRLVRFMAKDSVFTHPDQRPAYARHEAHPRRLGRRRGVVCRRGQCAARRRDRGRLPEATISRSFELKDSRTARPGWRLRPACRSPARHLGLVAGLDQQLLRRLGRTNVPIIMTVGEPIPVASDADVNEVIARASRRCPRCSTSPARPTSCSPGPDPAYPPASLGGTAPTSGPRRFGSTGRRPLSASGKRKEERGEVGRRRGREEGRPEGLIRQGR